MAVRRWSFLDVPGDMMALAPSLGMTQFKVWKSFAEISNFFGPPLPSIEPVISRNISFVCPSSTAISRMMRASKLARCSHLICPSLSKVRRKVLPPKITYGSSSASTSSSRLNRASKWSETSLPSAASTMRYGMFSGLKDAATFLAWSLPAESLSRMITAHSQPLK
jgi:hypothetical protein